jgi:hypothetical protein
VSVEQLLSKYFLAAPPFADSGKKKNEFPDAIVLLAIESWAAEKGIFVLAVAKDGDWESYCEKSERLDYENNLVDSLGYFNRANAPYALVESLENALKSGGGAKFRASVAGLLESYFDEFTPDQDAESAYYWEGDGSHGWFKEFEFSDLEFQVVDKAEDWVVLDVYVSIKVGAQGDFSLSVYDSVDKDYTPLDSMSVEVEEEFYTSILISIRGNLDGPIDELVVDEVEIIEPIESIHFGTLEPDFGDYEY